MRLSSCVKRLSLDVRSAAIAAAMVWGCLADSKVVSYFSALMRWIHIFPSLTIGDSALRNWLCLVEPVQNISVEGVQAQAGSISVVYRFAKKCWENSSCIAYFCRSKHDSMFGVVPCRQAFKCCAPSHLLGLRSSCLFPWFHLRMKVNQFLPESFGRQMNLTKRDIVATRMLLEEQRQGCDVHSLRKYKNRSNTLDRIIPIRIRCQ